MQAHQLYKEAVSLKVFPSVWQRPLVKEPGLTARPWWTADKTGYSSVLNTFTDKLDKIKRYCPTIVQCDVPIFLIVPQF